uniref:Mitochondrial import receptor subunit TOM20 homolog n=1 Tax=Phallusia mammillata TaxID=59560 RepID=A0A6F9DVX0_9ASCI|nr:mitochondrial import receptor subunit TOM20 homolog [Phallusia mammillata]
MIDMNKNTVLAIAGVCGTAFVGYCIYFDRKRRSDPDFRRKLKERRQKQQKTNTSSGASAPLPDLRDVEAVQKFFIEEVQKGEELLGQGNYQEAVEHLTNAVAVCGQPQQLLQILQQTLPQPVFAMLLERLPSISQRLSGANPAAQAKKDEAPSGATITDVDDLE